MAYTKHLKMVKDMTDFYGFHHIAACLGYKTPNTVRVWFNKKKVPKIAQPYVQELHSIKMTKKEQKKFVEQRRRDNGNHQG